MLITDSDKVAHVSNAFNTPAEVGELFTKRVQCAQQAFTERVRKAQEQYVDALFSCALNPWEAWQAWYRYGIDLAERSVLFWDTLRQRGNIFIEHERANLPPVLHFDYEMVMDARAFPRPVNYAMVRIIPPAGVAVDPKRRPYIIVDPRAGHGPGVAGFKDDSEIGVALHDGHPVYFVMFFRTPEPGQTVLDVCAAEGEFVKKVRELHPDAPKPVILGNCQGGWAVMMLAASNPELTGPIVINGAPMSYWSGASNPEQKSNPMRYLGGLAGGSWFDSFIADAGNGIFDGAWLVQNFENLNPANSFWDKYYRLFANIDAEPQRFLDFERWWGGFYLMNREEIDWICQKMFVGNRVWKETDKEGKPMFDLRAIKSPIILFASMGDNITPPQQAFNWVADTYGSTEEIKARGQTIIGLVHPNIGHLGIFVSGKVAKKEYASIVSVMKCVEALAPGLYEMKIDTVRDESGKETYDVEFIERQLEDVIERINRFGRRDEKPFRAAAISADLNQRAYEMFARPVVQALATDSGAELMRIFHPMRLQHWAFSDLNPWMSWLSSAAEMVTGNRHAAGKNEAPRRMEEAMSEVISASLDYYRDVRDAMGEAAFFVMYGNVFSLAAADLMSGKTAAPAVMDRRVFVEEALRSIAEGGYADAVARAAHVLAREGQPLPLALLELKEELIEEYQNLLPKWTPDESRRAIGKQEIIWRYAPEKAMATFPMLLSNPADRKRFLKLIDKLLADERVNGAMTPEQKRMVRRIRRACAAGVGTPVLRAG